MSNTIAVYNNKVKMADVIGFCLYFPYFTHTSLCSLNALIHRRIWTSYKFRKMDGLGRENGCHTTTSISPGERTERVETPRNWTKSASDHDGQSTAHKPQYAPSRCAQSSRRPTTRFRSLLRQVSQLKSSFSFSVSPALAPSPPPTVKWKQY